MREKATGISLFVMVITLLFGLSGEATQAGQPQTLHIYTWTDYFEPEVIRLFESKYDCNVTLDYFDSGDAMYAKIKNHGEGYDVIVAPSYFSAIMDQQGMLRELDHDSLPNLEYLDTGLAEITEDPAMRYAIPYTRVVAGVGYNRRVVAKEDVGSWKIFSTKTYAKRMTLANDVRETLSVALKYLGYSLNTTNNDELEKAGELIRTWKPNIAKFDIDEAKIGLASGEFFAVHGYNGDIALVMQENPEVDFFFPKEGSSLAVDQMIIAGKSKNPEMAHAFIDHMLNPEVAAENMKGIQYYMPNPAAIRLLPEEMRKSPAFSIPDGYLEKCEIIRDLGEDNVKYTDVWNSIKSH